MAIDDVRDLRVGTDPQRKLAPRSIRNIYGMLHTMFVDAKD